jgi:hypothetical protein
MTSKILKLSAGIALLIASSFSASAMPLGAPAGVGAGADIIPVAQGCGPGGWRGPWGGCRYTPYVGPLPGGGWVAPPSSGYYGNGCPPGYWRGPWGHCRNTPYHGRLPNGGWQ